MSKWNHKNSKQEAVNNRVHVLLFDLGVWCISFGWCIKSPWQTSWSRVLAEVWVQFPTEATCFKPLTRTHHLQTLHCQATLTRALFWRANDKLPFSNFFSITLINNAVLLSYLLKLVCQWLCHSLTLSLIFFFAYFVGNQWPQHQKGNLHAIISCGKLGSEVLSSFINLSYYLITLHSFLHQDYLSFVHLDILAHSHSFRFQAFDVNKLIVIFILLRKDTERGSLFHHHHHPYKKTLHRNWLVNRFNKMVVDQ